MVRERHAPGAPPPDSAIPLTVPDLKGNEWTYVRECLDTNWVSSAGPFVDRFERSCAEAVRAKHAVATVNGTSALHIALLVAGIRPEDEVLVSTLTFIAPVNTIRYAGAWPVLIDAEPEYWQMDPQGVAEFIRTRCRWRNGVLYNKTTRRRVRAVMPVHILGHPVDMDPILDIARQYKLTVIEDATESLGAAYKGRPTGHLGDIACLSFNGNKIITTGGGGMILTDRDDWAERSRYLTTQAKDDPVEYVHRTIGYNYRLTNVLAAMGVAQMEQLERIVTAKLRIAKKYTEAFGSVPGLTVMKQAPWASSTFWLYTILIRRKEFGLDSREVLRRLGRAGIQARPLWQPMHLSRAHRESPTWKGTVAARLNHEALSLPCSAGLTEAQQDRVIREILTMAKKHG